jgi:hypothetical protein
MMKWNKIRTFCLVLISGLVWVTAQAASLGDSDLPTDSNWYVHVNLDLIRNSEVGKQFMMETFNEAMDEIESELNVDIREEIEGVTIFGAALPAHGNPISDGAVVLHGMFSAETQSAILSALENKGAHFSKSFEAGLAYYTVDSDESSLNYTDEDGDLRDVSWGENEDLHFSFGSTQVLVTQSLEMMQVFLGNGGYLGGFEQAGSDALLIIEADRALMQGGANTSAEIAGEWDSSVLKNVDAVALVIEEAQGGVQINAQLTASSAEAAMSVRNIAEGLVALKALSDSEGVVGEVLRSVRFENEGSVLHVSVPVAADQIEALKDL